MERNRDVTCDTDDPNRLRFCDQTGELFQEFGAVPGIPFRHEWKVAASHPLPWGLQAGVSFVSYPGATCNCPGSSATAPAPAWPGPLNVLWTPTPDVFPGGQRTESVTAHLIAPGTKYLERWNQLDVTLKWKTNVGRFELLPSFEVYNLLNSNVVLNENQNFGSALGRPSQILQGRFIKLGALMRF
jgi:hypothetical protein